MNLELNKIAGGVLSAMLFAFGMKTAMGILMQDHPPEKPGYVLPAAAAVASAGAGAGAFTFAKFAPTIAKGNPDVGQEGFKKCAACHTVVGRPVAGVAGFAYSDATKAKGGNWDWELLTNYIYKPAAAIPGNKMAFAGIQDEADLADMMAYLRKLADTPVEPPK
jgi:cytochrome c